MSKHETPMVHRYWGETVGGTFLPSSSSFRWALG
jgi:hypothetical protein